MVILESLYIFTAQKEDELIKQNEMENCNPFNLPLPLYRKHTIPSNSKP
jgi:hypothetical protein